MSTYSRTREPSGGVRAVPAKDEPLTQVDYETLAAFRFALRRFASFSPGAARAVGLTTHQHQALLAIKGWPPGTQMTIGHLAEQLIVAPHTAAELVARLEGARLVRKIVDEADRRRIKLELMPRAETALRKLTLAHRREVRGLTPRLLVLLRALDTAEGNEAAR